ncbi:unnamed protein product [Fraxinus pennsylvanica]|uniref:Zinc finger PHD-type domain-containing protein n=1 Tax=Fraxinus pennsylvanica TaxID=56036 RepID=A0AAD1Z2K5_9LAMI|nr:unnamed protein product [Fraxinus pennsylvanica]
MFVTGARNANLVSASSRPKFGFDPSESCEAVLENISHKLKDAVLTGDHPLLSSLKEQSGFAVRNQLERILSVDDGDTNHVAATLEESNTNTLNVAASGQLIPLIPANGDALLKRSLPDEKLLVAKWNMITTTENVEGWGYEFSIFTCKKKCPPGDCKNEHPSLKGLVGHHDVLPCQRQVPHGDSECQRTNLTTYKVETIILMKQKLIRKVFASVWYNDEKTDISMKKHAFLSSQCTYSQDSLAKIDLCTNCRKGGTLLVCSSNSCLTTFHEGCLGSATIFDAGGKFYCPLCAYHIAISEYNKVKNKASVARKNLATFFRIGTKKRREEVSLRSRRKTKYLPEPDEHLHENSKVNNINISKRTNNTQCREDLIAVSVAEPSVSCAGDNPPSEKK